MSHEKKSVDPRHFFTDREKQKIVEAIRQAEKQTSGEIRLHLEKTAKKNVYHRAVKIFHKIGMDRTELKNGVLIYLATGDHQIVILGDTGINEIVPENFWNEVVLAVTSHFRNGDFCRGLCEGILMIGEKLKAHFPYRPDDRNELSNQISVQDD